MTAPEVVALLAAAVTDFNDSPELATQRWKLHPARVVTPSATAPTGVFDGDGVLGGGTTPVPLTSLIGYCAAGARIMVAVVPPAGNYVIADLSGATAEADAVAGSLAVTDSTQWTNPSGAASFVAPASGKVLITWAAEMTVTGGFFLISPQVTSSDGIHTGWDVNFDRTIRTGSAVVQRYGAADLCEGLTPGVTYSVTLWHIVSFGVTGTSTRRAVTVTPTP